MDFRVDADCFRSAITASINFIWEGGKKTAFWGMPETVQRRKDFLLALSDIIRDNPNSDTVLISKVREMVESASLNEEIFRSFYKPFNKILFLLDKSELPFLLEGSLVKYSSLVASLSSVAAVEDLQNKNAEIELLRQENSKLSAKLTEQLRALVIVERTLATKSLESNRFAEQSKQLITEYARKLEEASKRHDSQIKILAQSYDDKIATIKDNLSLEISAKEEQIEKLTEELEKAKSHSFMESSLVAACDDDFFMMDEPSSAKTGSTQKITF